MSWRNSRDSGNLFGLAGYRYLLRKLHGNQVRKLGASPVSQTWLETTIGSSLWSLDDLSSYSSKHLKEIPPTVMCIHCVVPSPAAYSERNRHRNCEGR